MTSPSNSGTLSPASGHNKSRQLLLMRDTSIQFPELWLNVYVSGPPGDAQGFPEMFARSRCMKANTPDEADLVVFTGGSDVDPAFYTDATVHESVYVDKERDAADLELYAKCYDEGIPMFGVCRGAQFGHVMNGGELFQDVDEHNGGHHFMFTGSESITVSSVHHQMCIKQEGMEVLGWAFKSNKRMLSRSMSEHGRNEDVEAFFYRDSCFFGVQGHPEYKGYLSFTGWCLKQIEQLIAHNPDLYLDKEKGVYRMKESLRQERDNQTIIVENVG